MDKVKTAVKWIFQDVFTASILVFLIIYSVWFWLATDENFPKGLVLFLLYAILAALYEVSKSKFWLKLLFLIPVALFWLGSIWFTVYAFPSIGDIAFHNGTIFILTHSEITLDPPYEGAFLTKWRWGLIPERHRLHHQWLSDEHFIYDQDANLVGILRFDQLTYLDGDPGHNLDIIGRYNDRWYYLNSVCVTPVPQENGFGCDLFRHTIYQCDDDNTGCTLLPMQYTGVEWYGDLEHNPSTNQLDYRVDHLSNTGPTTYILIYSYGAHPRCYVDGCEILLSP